MILPDPNPNNLQHTRASALIRRCGIIQDECLALIEERPQEFDTHYSAFLRYHNRALRLIEYRIKLMGASVC